jgi:mRNA interferase RelE/StbE
MKWRIDFSREAAKFLKQQDLRVNVVEELKKFLTKMTGGHANVDVKKLGGDWEGYYRVRKGKLRIIFDVDKHERVLYVERIDFRGDVYK